MDVNETEEKQPFKINKCRTDFTLNSQTIPALNNCKKFFGKSLERSHQKSLIQDKSSGIVEGTRKKIDN